MEMSETILSATDVYREFPTSKGSIEVLKGVSLEIGRGRMAAVTGASGVGKSTLLQILGGLDRPTRGSVQIANQTISGLSETALARFRNRTVGFVFQFHYLMDDFTALENVMMPLLIAGENRQRAAEQAELALGEVGLRDRTTHRPKELSGGEQQRVAVARALVNQPQIVLADEPSGNLDTTTGRKLHDLLFRINSETGTSFVIATHNRELAAECNFELRLLDGRIAEG